MTRIQTVSLVVASLASLAGIAPGSDAPAVPVLATAQESTAADEAEAQAELDKAQEEVAEGKFDRAHSRLEKLAEKFPETEAGKRAAERVRENALLGWAPVVHHGPLDNRVHVVFMQDSTELSKQDDFDDIANDMPSVFDHCLVFSEYFTFFDFTKAFVVSAEDGVDAYGRECNTALDAHAIQEDFGELVAVDDVIVRGMLSQMDADDAYAIVTVPLGAIGTGVPRVGTVGSRNSQAVLRVFGYCFGTLGDESAIERGYRGDVVNWINVANTSDPEKVPWAHFIEAKVRGVGVYEGAAGTLRGAWKPTASGCRMQGGDFYCPVCREALVLQIYEHVDPIDAARVATSPDVEVGGTLTGDDTHEFEVAVQMPKTHALEVDWYVFAEADAPREGGDFTTRPRRKRGTLEAIDRRPDKSTKGRRGVHDFSVNPKKLEPGRYKVVCRAYDTTEIRGEKYPWVIKDEYGLLESERTWWIRVD